MQASNIKYDHISHARSEAQNTTEHNTTRNYEHNVNKNVQYKYKYSIRLFKANKDIQRPNP